MCVDPETGFCFICADPTIITSPRPWTPGHVRSRDGQPENGTATPATSPPFPPWAPPEP